MCVAALDEVTQSTRTGTLGPKKASKQPKKPKATGTLRTYDNVDEIDEVVNDKNKKPKRGRVSPDSDDGDSAVDELLSDSDSDDGRQDNTIEELKWGLDRQHENSDWQSKIKGKVSFYARRTAELDDPNAAFPYFKMMFPVKLANEIATETNRFALAEAKKQAERSSKPRVTWNPTTGEEIYVFVGIAIAMALNPQKGGYKQYWLATSNGGLVGANLGRYMTLRRYIDLRKNLHFTDNDTDVAVDHPKYDKLKKLRCVVDTFNGQSKKFFTLGDTTSVDEGMVKFFGRSYLKQYMQNKPTKYGFKFWSLNDPDTGYFYLVEPYTGKRPGEAPTKGLGAAVVLNLAEQANLRPGTAIACDRFFGSIDLLLQLQKKKLFCVCTLQTNRLGFPKDLVIPKKGGKKLARGDTLWATCATSKISVVCWIDSKPVYVAGTVGQIDGDICERSLKRTDRVPGGPTKVNLPRPFMISHYNKWMGGTDLGDKFRNFLDLEQVSTYTKWYKKLFFGIVGCMVVNASIVYARHVKTDSWRDRGLFLRYGSLLQRELLEKSEQQQNKLKTTLQWVHQSPQPQPDSGMRTPPRKTRRITANTTVTVSPMDTFDDTASPQLAQLQLDHKAVHIFDKNDKPTQRECVYCKHCTTPSKRGTTRPIRTSKKCAICDAPLCQGKRNCFQLYHSDLKAQQDAAAGSKQYKSWSKAPK
jgi:hypothetical protein